MTLAFIPKTYLFIIYHNSFEFWHLVHNPVDMSIDVKAYPVYVQQGSTIPFWAHTSIREHRFDDQDMCVVNFSALFQNLSKKRNNKETGAKSTAHVQKTNAKQNYKQKYFLSKNISLETVGK